MQGGAAHELHVVVALAEHPHAGLAHDGERLDQQVVERLAVVEPLAELAGLGPEGVVGQRLHLGLELADVGHQRLERPHLLALAGAEEAVKQCHASVECTGADRPRFGRARAVLMVRSHSVLRAVLMVRALAGSPANVT